MDNRIEMDEVYSAEELKALEGCTITSVYSHGPGGDEGLCIDCRDEAGGLVSFLITEEETWHLYDNKEQAKKNLTLAEYGKIAQIFINTMVDSIFVRRVGTIPEFIVKVIGQEAAASILESIKVAFSLLEVSKGELILEGELYPVYRCDIPDYNLNISLAVMSENKETSEGTN